MYRYQHTQIGWTLLAVAGVAVAIIATSLWFAEARGAVALPLILLVPAIVFSTLKVSVTDEAMDIRFGPGPIRRRVALSAIQSCVRVRNPWYYGWGMHFTPRGRLYNVSGFDAIELSLKDGTHLRVGTDDPDGLLAALRAGIADSAGTASDGLATPRFSTALGSLIPLAPVLLIVGAILYLGMRPVDVTVSSSSVVVSGGGFSNEIRAADIVRVSLEDVLPPIQRRTSGFGLGRTLRGSFRLRDQRSAHLFVEGGHPPYVAVETRHDFVMINFKDPAQTHALYSTLSRMQHPQ